MSCTTGDLTSTALVADVVRSSMVDGPGHRYVVFLQGCDFDCIACHNPQTIPGHAPMGGHRPRRRTVADILHDLRPAAPFLRGVTLSGGEVTLQWRFAREFFAAMHDDPHLAGLDRLIDTNGNAEESVWRALAPHIDGAMVDLKCIDDSIHRIMTGQSNENVLRSIECLRGLGLLHEVRLLIVEGVNDAPELIERTGHWLATIDPTMRLKLIGFRSHGVRPHDPPLSDTSKPVMQRAVSILGRIADFELTVV